MSTRFLQLPGRWSTRVAGLAAAVLCALATVVVAPGAASAHTELVGSDPAAGAAVDRAMTEITLRFESDIRPELTEVLVRGRTGGSAVLGRPTVSGAQATVRLRPLTVAGQYQVAYRVVGEDAHPVSGVFQFHVTAAGAAAARHAAAGSSYTAASAAPAIPSGSVLPLLGLAAAASLVVLRVRAARVTAAGPAS
jgi:methionine-rich copper-binding protein CopC